MTSTMLLKSGLGRFRVSPFDAVERELTDFWVRDGKRTKAYRDCFLHFATLAGATWQHHVNMRFVNGAWRASLELPSNPEIKWVLTPLSMTESLMR